MTGSVRVGVLGPLSVEVDGRAHEAPRAEVVRGLLGVLLLAGREPLSVERLIPLVWDDRAGHTRPASVHVAVTRLRSWLDEAGLAAELRREGCGYLLGSRSTTVARSYFTVTGADIVTGTTCRRSSSL